MNIADVKSHAFAMPLTSPAFPRGPYRFNNREFLVISYRTDADALRAVVPEHTLADTLDLGEVVYDYLSP